jgi:hypothetical protein
MKGIALAFTSIVVLACRESPLPTVRAGQTNDNCLMPAPPPGVAEVISRAKDPVHCLPPSIREQGIRIEALLSADGRAADVDTLHLLCMEIGPDDAEMPPYTLDAETKRCILDDLREWTFARLDTCQSQSALVTLSTSPAKNGKSQAAGPNADRRALAGGLTGCT